MPELADHILMMLIAIILPVFGYPSWGKLRRQILQGRSGLRKKLYVLTLVMESFFSLLVLAVWWSQNRPLSTLGLSIPMNLRFIVVLTIALLACLFYVRQWVQIVKLKGAFPELIKTQTQQYAGILPETPGERSLYALLSFVTGICEELLYRGFLIWYFRSWTNIGIAILLPAFVFGIAHGYQGSGGIRKTMLWGTILGTLYLISGSLVGPILLHAVLNLSTGFIGSEILKYSDTPQEA
jgi:membrane protease YdiL (CAAX protease family)